MRFFIFFQLFLFCSSFISMSMEVMIPYIVCEKINYFVFNSKAKNNLKRNK